MSLVFAAAISHAPGYVAWTDMAPVAQKDSLYAAAETLRQQLDAAKVEALVLFTSEHWANFFLDHISPAVIGRADTYFGPVEPWLKMERTAIPGDAALASEILALAYERDIAPGYAHELEFDHGTMIPLKFLTPNMKTPVTPIVLNALASPQPSPRYCAELGRAVGDVVRASPKRIGLIATGGMSHDPGEVGHGHIDEAFDRRFLAQMAAGDLDALKAYSVADLGAAGAGAIELLNWIALAGAMGRFSGEIVAYEAVVPWATGMGLMTFQPQDAERP